MSVANDALLSALGAEGFPVVDGLVSLTAVTAAAPRLTGAVNRFIKISVAANRAVLPSLLSMEAGPLIFVINDDPADSLSVVPFIGETQAGVANQAVAIPAGQSAIFIAVRAAQIGKGGGIPHGSIANDWRAAVIP